MDVPQVIHGQSWFGEHIESTLDEPRVSRLVDI